MNERKKKRMMNSLVKEKKMMKYAWDVRMNNKMNRGKKEGVGIV